MESHWSQDDIFPAIARAINELHAQHLSFVSHDDIIEYLLQDAEALAHIDSARESSDEEHTREWLAHNMVAWFSQRITVGDSEWKDRLERQKQSGKWAYKPVV